MPLPRQRAQYSPHRLRLRARQLQENTSRFFSLLSPCRDADTDGIDVPDCLLRGASPQREALLSVIRVRAQWL